MTLQQALHNVAWEQWTGPADAEVRSVAFNAGRVTPGSLFCTWRGSRSDGHHFIPTALERGASALVVENDVPCPPQIPRVRVACGRTALASIAANFHNHPSTKLEMIGVTGTNGKTSTTWLLHHALQYLQIPCGLLGTVEYRSASRMWPAARTTPESLDLQEILAEMVADGCRAAAMEVSSHALALQRVAGLHFKHAVFTNFSHDHLDFHGDMESYFKAKASLFTSLQAGSTAIINGDDPRCAELKARTPAGVNVITYGTGKDCQSRAMDISMDAEGLSFNWLWQGSTTPVRSSWLGSFQIHNILAASSVLAAMGHATSAIAEAIAHVPDVPGRMQRVPFAGSFSVLVDYAHTDDALSRALQSLRPITRGRLLVLIGCGGDRDASKRPLMASAAASLADAAVFTSDNPRSEDPELILADMLGGVQGCDNVRVIADRAVAIRSILQEARDGDVVLLAGKGHEQTQEIGGIHHPFSDVDTATQILNKLRGCAV